MVNDFIDEEVFDKVDFREKPLKPGIYEKCTFKNCDFSNNDLSGTHFMECEFMDCNLSLVKLKNVIFRDVRFRECKLLGLRFNDCSEFGFSVHFDNCIVNHSSFFKTSLKKKVFNHTQFHEVDFTECDLSNSTFEACDLNGAMFENTNLENTDFRTAVNYSINPEINRIKKAKFSLQGVRGLLDRYHIEIED
jgi:fluoroquinolone resistance protein